MNVSVIVKCNTSKAVERIKQDVYNGFTLNQDNIERYIAEVMELIEADVVVEAL